VRFGDREDTILGACVLIICASLLGWLHGRDAVPPQESGYTLTASFQRSDGLNEGADVRLAGIAVGKVTSMKLDEQFRSIVKIQMNEDIAVPRDSAAVIHTNSLFGGKYIELEPGGALDNLQNGDNVEFTQDALIIDDLLAHLTAVAKSRNTKCAAKLAEEPPKCEQSSPNQMQKKTPSLLLPLSSISGKASPALDAETVVN